MKRTSLFAFLAFFLLAGICSQAQPELVSTVECTSQEYEQRVATAINQLAKGQLSVEEREWYTQQTRRAFWGLVSIISRRLVWGLSRENAREEVGQLIDEVLNCKNGLALFAIMGKGIEESIQKAEDYKKTKARSIADTDIICNNGKCFACDGNNCKPF